MDNNEKQMGIGRTFLDTEWLNAEQASFHLGRPLEEMQRLYAAVLAGRYGKVAINNNDPTKPSITGRSLLELIGALPPPTARHRSTRN
jgi:hypothetical protein